MAPKIDFTSLADFLGGAIKDAGAGAQLAVPEDKTPTTPTPSNAPLATTQAMTSASRATTGPKKRGGKNQEKKAAKVAQVAVPNRSAPEDHIRKLVTIRRVDAVESFDLTNNLIHIEGWTVRAPKAKNISKGELVIFLEIDTFLPARTEHERAFSEVGNVKEFEGQMGYVVTTNNYISPQSKRSVISQGHVYKLTQFVRIWADVNLRRVDFPGSIGDFAKVIRKVDFTSNLCPGVRKWTDDTPEPNEGQAAKFPKFIKKTSMDRVENCPNLFIKAKYKTAIYQESVKMDGQSMTMYFVNKDSRYYSQLPPLTTSAGAQLVQFPNGRFGVCSKNQDLPFSPDNNYWRAALQHNYPAKLANLGKTIAVQGELVGDKINSNMHNYPPGTVEFWMYSVYEIHGSKRWDPRVVEKFAKELSVRHVIVTGYGVIRDFARKHSDFQIKADLSIGDEGYVYKNCSDGRWFKVLSRRFILEKEELIRGGETEEEDEDEDPEYIRGYAISDEDAESWIDLWEAGCLKADFGVQAFIAEWEKMWGGPVPGSTKASTKKESRVIRAPPKASPKKAEKPAESKPAWMNSAIDWLAEGNEEARKWKESKGGQDI